VTKQKIAFSTLNVKGHTGISVKGEMFLKTIQNPSPSLGTLTGNDTRMDSIIYLHPNIIVSRLSKIAAAFTKYRFRHIQLEYHGRAIVTDAAEVFMAYSSEPGTDLSLLRDRKLRLWFENTKDNYMGNVASDGRRAIMSTNLADDKWYETGINHTEIDAVFQGKLFIAVWGQVASNSEFGDISLSYSLELADAELDVQDIIASTTVEANFDILTVPEIGSGGDVAPISCPASVDLQGPGVFSLVSNSEPSQSNHNWSKTIRQGVEFIGSAVGVPGLPLIMTAYDTITDLLNGDPTTNRPGATSDAFPWRVHTMKLLGRTIKNLFGHGERNELYAIPAIRRQMEEYRLFVPCSEIINGELVFKPTQQFPTLEHARVHYQGLIDSGQFHKSYALALEQGGRRPSLSLQTGVEGFGEKNQNRTVDEVQTPSPQIRTPNDDFRQISGNPAFYYHRQ